VSPKTLATVLEHCIDQQGVQDNSASRDRDLSPKSSNEDSTEMADGESEAVEEEIPKAPESQANGEPTKKVLLVEDNSVNLKVRKLTTFYANYLFLTFHNYRSSRLVSRMQD
jgi:hypothetical protein